MKHLSFTLVFLSIALSSIADTVIGRGTAWDWAQQSDYPTCSLSRETYKKVLNDSKVKALTSAIRKCGSNAIKIADLEKNERCVWAYGVSYEITSSAEYQCDDSQYGKNCSYPVRRCNDGTNNRDCPPCY